MEATLLAVAQQYEKAIDDEIAKLDNLGDEDINQLRQRRLWELKKQQEKSREWLARGHGEYRELTDEKQFFAEMKGEERMICHFYRESVPCRVMDKHMSILAKKHLETKFVKVNAEKSPFLTERLKIWMLPTLALVKHEKVEDYVVGFDDMGGTDDFTTDQLAERLAAVEMIKYDGPSHAGPAPEQRAVRAGFVHRTGSDEDSDFDG